MTSYESLDGWLKYYAKKCFVGFQQIDADVISSSDSVASDVSVMDIRRHSAFMPSIRVERLKQQKKNRWVGRKHKKSFLFSFVKLSLILQKPRVFE